MFVGFLLLLIGALMLLDRLGLIYGSWTDYLVPAALIALGAQMIFSRRRPR